ncbi:hypothetical protein bas06_0088 [Escherichia phage KarlJaspers]|uniref:Uncharacterized protein n=1 Tax=Escherichia phage KarlJaspers TaxID=2851970 RepID=A0AAE7VW84_9CAUD|nr:hypothetical protein [Shigella flexneri]QXV82341.1 hypothetical protein bas06_0088 [Escherichia phage KarlJaspers]
MKYKVRLTIRRMGRNCSSCRQSFECEVEARGELEAAARAKELSGANQDTHQFSIDLVRKMS